MVANPTPNYPDIKQNTTKRPIDAPMTKGTFPKPAKYAQGGPTLTGRSIFMKQPDPFRTDTERSDYGGKDPLAKAQGDTKSLKPIKPRS